MEWGGEFRKKHKEWKERMLECKLESWFLNLTLSLTGNMNLSKSSSLSTSVSLPIKWGIELNTWPSVSLPDFSSRDSVNGCFLYSFLFLFGLILSKRGEAKQGILEWFSAIQVPFMFYSIKASDYAVRLQYKKPTLVKRQGSIVSRRQDKKSLGLEFTWLRVGQHLTVNKMWLEIVIITSSFSSKSYLSREQVVVKLAK